MGGLCGWARAMVCAALHPCETVPAHPPARGVPDAGVPALAWHQLRPLSAVAARLDRGRRRIRGRPDRFGGVRGALGGNLGAARADVAVAGREAGEGEEAAGDDRPGTTDPDRGLGTGCRRCCPCDGHRTTRGGARGRGGRPCCGDCADLVRGARRAGGEPGAVAAGRAHAAQVPAHGGAEAARAGAQDQSRSRGARERRRRRSWWRTSWRRDTGCCARLRASIRRWASRAR